MERHVEDEIPLPSTMEPIMKRFAAVITFALALALTHAAASRLVAQSGTAPAEAVAQTPAQVAWLAALKRSR